MPPINGNKTLFRRYLRFSKRLVAVSLGLLVLGFALILGAPSPGRLVGVVICGLALVALSLSGYYWGCDNESCS
jgi:hypothetical protein